MQKTEHTFGEWKVIKEATEEAKGSKERTCTVCECKVTESIEKLAHTHTFAEEWSRDETNHWHAATCGCSDVELQKTEHTFGEWEVIKEATEEAEGSKERTCTVCECKVTESIEKLAHTHTFAEEWSRDETNHWHAATCGCSDVELQKTEHTFGEWEVIKEATEEAEGSKERTCTVCDYKATEKIEKLEHTHKFATGWTSDTENHWHASTCGHEVTEGKTAHTFGDWTVTKVATKEAKGSKERVCTVCNYKEVVDIAKISKDFVLIPAGSFQMGSNEGYDKDKPVHEVTITKPFYMGKYEVTQAEYEKYCSYTGSNSPKSSYGDGDNYPAYYVSWYDALVYCNKRSIAEGLTPCYSIKGSTDPKVWGTVPSSEDATWDAATCDFNASGYRLPTEAEWEYAARAGDNTVDSLTYSGTSDVSKLGDYAWYKDNSDSTTHEVGTKKANAFGLYDMSGNVYEWCWNWYTDSYDTETEGGSDPTGSSAGSFRVGRGGSWGHYSDYCAVSFRNYGSPYYLNYSLGFRVVRQAN